VDTVIVWKLDRLGRSLKNLIETLNLLKDRGVDFISLAKYIDTTTPWGKLIFHLMGAMAEFERDLIRERTNAGLAAARARGEKEAGPENLQPMRKLPSPSAFLLTRSIA
jgi:DNA invertase Pin-like site-specific DNA recombinase